MPALPRLIFRAVVSAALIAAPPRAAASAASADGQLVLVAGACPPGYTELSAAQGRLLLLVGDALQAGDAAGFPLSDAEDRGHAHLVSGSFDFPSKHVASTGGANFDGAKRGAQPLVAFLNISAAAPSGYPFAQFAVCRYSAFLGAPPPVLPSGGLSLWDPATTAAGCPAGSAPLPAAVAGRILAVSNASGASVAGGAAALEPGGDVAHAHAFSATVSLDSLDFAGIVGCCDDDPTSDGAKSMSAVSGAGGTALPHLSVLACNTTNASAPAALPAGALLLSTAGAPCPAGWAPLAAALAGRLVVGTPPFGVPGRTFGGAPLPPDASAWAPSHTHAFEVTVETNPAGIGLAKGCCAHGYGAAGTYVAQGTLDAALANVSQQLPLLIVQACVEAVAQ
jgi:hypothetical protein